MPHISIFLRWDSGFQLRSLLYYGRSSQPLTPREQFSSTVSLFRLPIFSRRNQTQAFLTNSEHEKLSSISQTPLSPRYPPWIQTPPLLTIDKQLRLPSSSSRLISHIAHPLKSFIKTPSAACSKKSFGIQRIQDRQIYPSRKCAHPPCPQVGIRCLRGPGTINPDDNVAYDAAVRLPFFLATLQRKCKICSFSPLHLCLVHGCWGRNPKSSRHFSTTDLVSHPRMLDNTSLGKFELSEILSGAGIATGCPPASVHRCSWLNSLWLAERFSSITASGSLVLVPKANEVVGRPIDETTARVPHSLQVVRHLVHSTASLHTTKHLYSVINLHPDLSVPTQTVLRTRRQLQVNIDHTPQVWFSSILGAVKFFWSYCTQVLSTHPKPLLYQSFSLYILFLLCYATRPIKQDVSNSYLMINSIPLCFSTEVSASFGREIWSNCQHKSRVSRRVLSNCIKPTNISSPGSYDRVVWEIWYFYWIENKGLNFFWSKKHQHRRLTLFLPGSASEPGNKYY
jgi:hypothetical protein